MNIKLLTLGPQNFDHTSMGNPGAKLKTQKPKTQNSNITQNPNSKIQNPKPKTLRVQPLISTDLFCKVVIYKLDEPARFNIMYVLHIFESSILLQ